MDFCPLPATIGPAEALRLIVQGVCRVLGERERHNPLIAPIALLVWTRVRRAFLEFSALAEKLRAGTLRPYRPRGPHPKSPEAPPETADAPADRPSRKPRLPTGVLWLVRRLPEAAVFGSQLRYLLGDPEMQAILSDPRAVRILRPLCRMLVEPPLPQPMAPLPRPPRPPREPKPRKPRPPSKAAVLRAMFPGYRLPVPPWWDVPGTPPPRTRAPPPRPPPPSLAPDAELRRPWWDMSRMIKEI